MFDPDAISIGFEDEDDSDGHSWVLSPFQPLVATTEDDPDPFAADLWAYVRWAWPIMRPGLQISDPEYLEAICLHLQQITDPASVGLQPGEGNRHLLLGIEPRSGKSDLLALWASWEWGPKRMPWLRHLVATHRTDALEECHEALIRLLLSTEYQDRWGRHAQKGHLWSWNRLNLSAGGGRQLVSKRMTIQGLPAHRLICDDLIGDLEVDRPDARRKAMRFFNGSFRSRGLEKLATPTVVTHQGLHIDDPIRRLEREEGLRSHTFPETGYRGTWDRLLFQTEYTGPVSDTALTRAGLWSDVRSHGQYLRKSWTEELVARAKRRPEIWWPQHQQQPRSGQDAVWKRWWFRFWHYPGEPRYPVLVRLPDGTEREIACEPLPKTFDRQVQSWDLAFKASATSSAVAGSVWGQSGSRMYWLHSRQARLDILGSIGAILEMSKAWPETTAKLIEDKANGPAVEALIKSRVSGILLLTPQGSKAQRAGAAAGLLDAGNVYLPHPSLAPWVGDFLDWCDQWTGASDTGTDLLDTASQALLWMSKQAGQSEDKFELSALDPWHERPKAGSRWEDD
jgi:phage terminase large subunit-like protein